MLMLDSHEFSGTITYETNLGIECADIAYNLILAEDADEDLLIPAAKTIGYFIALSGANRTTDSSYN